jgi:hypothetical protein
MTSEQFDAAYRAFTGRRPFRPLYIEFVSGNQILISHPEAVRNDGQFYVARGPDGGFILFAAESVSRLFG